MVALPNPVRRSLHVPRPRPLDTERADRLVERLRDVRARLRLGLDVRDEIDVLCDEAATELETAAEIAAAVRAHQGGRGELIWVPPEHLYDVFDILDRDSDEKGNER